MSGHLRINGHRAKVVHLRPVVIRSPKEKAAYGRLRRKAEAAVERLIALLDEISGNPDLEDSGDAELEENDTDLGATHGLNQARRWQNAPGWAGFVTAGEPALASTPREDATGLYAAAGDEREHEWEGGGDEDAI